jgi:hypothetical protein
MERQQGRHMANDQISLDEYIKQLNTRVEGLSINGSKLNQLGLAPIEPVSYTHSSGTSDPYYGAVPNVNIGSTTHTSATGINVSPTIWTTTTNNTSGYTFSNQNIQPNNTVHIKGKDADLLINDKSLKTWMEKVEERLNILTPNPEMEKEWDDLRKLGERYRKLEKKCKEKSDMWNKLKAMPKPEIK